MNEQHRTVRPVETDVILDHLDRVAWAARGSIARLKSQGPLWSLNQGKLLTAMWVLRESGALPYPARPSPEMFERAIIGARASLPRGFKHMPVVQAREWLVAHGVKAALYEVPHLQRHLVAGLHEHEDVVVAAPLVTKPNQE